MTDHQIFWISILGVLELAAVLTVAASFLRRFRPATESSARASLAAIAVFAAFVVFSVVQMNRVRQGSAPVTEFLPSVAVFGESIRHHLETTGTHLPLVRIGQEEWGVAAGILLELQRLGIPFRVEESWASMFPAEVRERGDEDVELTIAPTGSNPELSKRAGDSLIDVSTHVEVHGMVMKRRSPARSGS